MPKQRLFTHLLAVVALASLLGIGQIADRGWLQEIERSIQDVLARRGRPAVADPSLVFLARDTASANLEQTDLDKLFDLSEADPESRRALKLMAHDWPWSREVYALVLDRLMAAGARAVAFDFTFPKPSASDDAFRESLARHCDKVVVAANIADELDGAASAVGAPTPTLISETSPRDSRIGFDNFWPDSDGIVRNAQYSWSMQHGIWHGSREFSLAARLLQKAGSGPSVPMDELSRKLRFAGPPGTFRSRSIHEIFVPEYWKHNFSDGAFFRGKIVVIGALGNWQHDEHQSAMGLMSGAELQLNAVNAAMHGDFLKPPPRKLSISLWTLAAVISLVCCLRCGSPLSRIGLILLIDAAWIAAQVLLLNSSGTLIPVAGPLAILTLTVGFSITFDLVCAGAEHLRLRRAVAERKRAQEVLQSANEELERRVGERTLELSKSNESLSSLLAEKDVLLKEIHHRVKNNLQTISSLLNLQSGNIKDPDDLRLFMETRNRVRSMSLIHEKLYQSHDLARVDFADYVKALMGGLAGSFAGQSSAVKISVDVEDIMLPVDSAVPCGLIINELVTNCFKYAFSASGAGEIRVAMKRGSASRLQLSVSDNGIGFPKGLDFRNTESLGMQLVTTLTEQLDGTVILQNGSGTTFEIDFPELKKIKS